MRPTCLPALAIALLACACSRTPAPEAPVARGDSAPARAQTPPPAAAPSPAPAPAPVDTPPGATTIPDRFRGTWAADAAACNAPGHESHLRVSADGVAFHESRGTLRSAREDGDTLVAVLMLTGEGNSWESTRRFTLSSDGTRLHDADSGMTRVRCP